MTRINILVLAVTVFVGLTYAQKATSTSTIIATFKGSGLQTLPPFVTKGPWEIRWKANDDFFLDLNGNGQVTRVVEYSPDDPASKSGVVRQEKAGQFNLEVAGLATWHIDIVSKVPVTNTIHKSHVVATFSGGQTEPLGSNEYHTPIFSVNSAWEAKFSSSGSFAIFLHNADGSEDSDRQGSASGYNSSTTYCSKPGKFYYTVLAGTDWHIVIRELK